MNAATDTGWISDALCAQVGGEAWFPERGQPTRPAKRVCQACPVRSQCLEYALATHQHYGVWGGLSYGERLAVRASRQAPAHVGTVAA